LYLTGHIGASNVVLQKTIRLVGTKKMKEIGVSEGTNYTVSQITRRITVREVKNVLFSILFL
jgi:hypothetical protein